MKILKADRITDLKQEINLLRGGSLNHPNIVRFRESYKTKKGHLCIVMDYADGGDLATAVSKLQARNSLWIGIVNSPFGGNTATHYGPLAGSLSEATGGNIFEILDREKMLFKTVF